MGADQKSLIRDHTPVNIKDPLEQPYYSAILQGEDFPDVLDLAWSCSKMLRMYAEHNRTPDGEPRNARIELKRSIDGTTWDLRLNIDPCVWFVQFLKQSAELSNRNSSPNSPNKSTSTTSNNTNSSTTPGAPIASDIDTLPAKDQLRNAAKIARTYIEVVKTEHANSSHSRNQLGNENQSISKVLETMCKYPTSCEFAIDHRGCKSFHSEDTCAWVCDKRGGFKEPCSWMCHTTLQIRHAPYTDSFFVLQVQKGKPYARDLLMFPRPLPIKVVDKKVVHFGHDRLENWDPTSWKGHYTNRELVQMPFFWVAVRTRIAALRETTKDPNAVETIALNFGEWESKQAQDEYSLECHGHAHLVLSRDAQARLVLSEATKELWAPLNGRFRDPPHYAFNDALALESRYVLGEEMCNLENKVDALNAKIDGFSNTIHQTVTAAIDSKLGDMFTQNIVEQLFQKLQAVNLPK